MADARALGEGFLLPPDRGFERWDEPELLRGRGGEDARVAMLGRLQDQWPDGRVTRRAQLGSARRCRNRRNSGPEVVETRRCLPHGAVHQDLRAIII